MMSKQPRIHKFFRSNNRSFILAIDHGMMVGSIKGINNIHEILKKVVDAPIDGLLASPVLIDKIRQTYPSHPFPLIYTVDYALMSNLVQEQGKQFAAHRLLWGVEDAVKSGADAVKLFLNFGGEKDPLMDNIKSVREIVKQSEDWGVPVMVEILFLDNKQFQVKENQQQMMEDACRITYELGADFLKIPMIEQMDAYRNIVRDIPAPVFVLGGAKMKEDQLVTRVRSLLQAGIHGVAFGRNIWQSDDMTGVMKRLEQVIHES